MITRQIISIPIEDELKAAEKYFGVMNVLNDLGMANREIQLVAFTAIKGNIGSLSKKEEFVKIYGSSLATIGNIITSLSQKVKGKKKSYILQKEKKIVFVNKGLLLNFKEDIQLDITLKYAEEE